MQLFFLAVFGHFIVLWPVLLKCSVGFCAMFEWLSVSCPFVYPTYPIVLFSAPISFFWNMDCVTLALLWA
jgi:hypothetical protein